MNHIVMDLEWNQALFRENTVHEPVTLHGEIIQIGAVKLDDKFNIADSFKIIIKPKHYRILNKHIEKLTGITQYQLEHGVPFPEAIKKFRAFCGRHCVLMIWGSDDIAILRDNLLIHGMDTDWLPKYYNLQVMFNEQVSGETRQWSLEDAMTAMMIENDLAAHDALNDASNTAKIVQKLDMKTGMGNYEQSSVRMQYCVSHSQTTKFSGFESLEDAFSCRDALRSNCPVCSKKMPMQKWIGNIYTRKVTVLRCPLHGKFKVTLHVSKEQDGTYTLTKSVKTANLDTIERYESKIKGSKNKLFRKRAQSLDENIGDEL